MEIERLQQYHNIATQDNNSVLLSYGMIVAESNSGNIKITRIGKKYLKYKDIEKAIAKYKKLKGVK